MELKEAYKQAFGEVLEELKAEGKIVVQEGLEDSAELFYTSLKKGLARGAELSDEPWDNVVTSFLPTLDKVVEPAIDNINKADND